MTARGRNHSFDLLRIVFAMLVLLSHAAEIEYGNASHELFSRFTGTQITFGTVGVDGFFLLSGYLIVQSWLGDAPIETTAIYAGAISGAARNLARRTWISCVRRGERRLDSYACASG